MRVAYVVSRFPSSSETFIARELNHVSAQPGIEVGLGSLFIPKESLVHPSAEPWMNRVHRPGAAESAAAVGWWLVRRPLRLLGCVAVTAAACIRRPVYAARSLMSIPAAAAHARRFREQGVDRVHAHYATYPALAAWVARRLADLPYSFTVHAHDIFVNQEMLAGKIAEADFVIAVSEFNRRFLASFGGDAATPVHVVHCGIELRNYEFKQRSVPAEGPVRALCVASLQEHKGHRVLLEALARGGPLARVELDLVGAGPLQGALEAQIESLGLSERVRLHGAQSEGRVREHLGAADLFVLPSLVARDGQMEGLPVVLMEALATGLPTVASSLSGIPELIEDGRTGYLAEPGDPDSLAVALGRALDGGVDPAEGRARVERDFDITATAPRLAELFGPPPLESARRMPTARPGTPLAEP